MLLMFVHKMFFLFCFVLFCFVFQINVLDFPKTKVKLFLIFEKSEDLRIVFS